MLADDALIASQRLSEWMQPRPRPRGRHRALQHRARPARPGPAAARPGRRGRPVAGAGAARGVAGAARGRPGVLPRATGDFRNVRLVELDNGDFAVTIVKLLLFSSARIAVFEQLVDSRDHVLSAVAAKGVKELTYHRDYAGRWFLTLARGTEESRRRIDARPRRRSGRCRPSCSRPTRWRPAVAEAGVGVDPATVADEVAVVLAQVFALSGVEQPDRRADGRRPGSPGPRRHAHRGAQPDARPSCRSSPAPTRWAGGDHDPTTSARVLLEHLEAPCGTGLRERALAAARTVTDPEMPMLTLDDLGVLRDVEVSETGRRHRRDHADLLRLPGHGHDARRPRAGRSARPGSTPRVRVALIPGLVERLDHRPRAPGRCRARPVRARARAARPGRSPCPSLPTRRELTCPRCGSASVELTSEFGPTACKALYRCTACLEPFEHVKEI